MHADHDAHAPAPQVSSSGYGSWLAATLLFIAGLGLLFALPARHGVGRNLAPATAAHPSAPRGAEASRNGDLRAPAARPGVAPSEQQRLQEVLAAMAGPGVSDDSDTIAGATADIQFLIKYVAQSGLSYKLNGEPKTATDVAEMMLKRFQNAADPFFSAYIFIRRTAGYTLVEKLLNRVILADGTEKPLADWLRNRLEEHQGLPISEVPVPIAAKKAPKKPK